MERSETVKKTSNAKIFKKFPFQMVELDEATQKRVSDHFKGPNTGLLLVGPEKWIMPEWYAEEAESLYNFEARPDDIYLCTFTRSGTTWTQEIIWLLVNDLNYEAAKATKLVLRFPFFEAPAMLAKKTSQRLIKTHLPMKLMPYDAIQKGCKIVYVARNPKDVIVSNFYFAYSHYYMYDGNFEEFVDFFLDDLITWGPYFEHIKDGWSHRNEKNILFLFYENLVMDLKGSLTILAEFLERPLVDSDLPQLLKHLSFENFKQNPSVNRYDLRNNGTATWDFVRRGKIGGNPEMTPEISERVDEWIEKQLINCDLKFPQHKTAF